MAEHLDWRWLRLSLNPTVTRSKASGAFTMRLPRIERCPGCNPLRGATTSSAATNVGWAFGAGYQVALTRWLMLKAEYLYYEGKA